jgi:hypothetical protein
MKRKATERDWLPLARTGRSAEEPPTGEAFRSDWIDFDRGIRVGNLQPHERITRILKHGLESRYGTDFVTDRWGRGVYWQWICWLPRTNRAAKPISSDANFGCAKLFISVLRERRIFQCGLQIERGFISGRPALSGILLREDWDWHRLMKGCAKGTRLDAELRRLLLREGFSARIEGEGAEAEFAAGSFSSARQIREAARRCGPEGWAGFQLYYPMPESEVRGSSGYELVRGIFGVFAEVIEAMNICMQIRLAPSGLRTGRGNVQLP